MVNIRRSKLHYTASGIITRIGGRLVHKGSRKLRFTDYVTMAKDGGKVVGLTLRPLFIPQEILLVLISVRG